MLNRQWDTCTNSSAANRMEIKTIPSPLNFFLWWYFFLKRQSTHTIYTIFTQLILLQLDKKSALQNEWQYAVGNDALHLTQRSCALLDNVCSFSFSPHVKTVSGGWYGKQFYSSCWGLNGGFDLSRCSFLLLPRVLADKGAVLVELNILVAIVHQAVTAVPCFDLSAQRVLAALQWLLVIVTAREAQWI